MITAGSTNFIPKLLLYKKNKPIFTDSTSFNQTNKTSTSFQGLNKMPFFATQLQTALTQHKLNTFNSSSTSVDTLHKLFEPEPIEDRSNYNPTYNPFNPDIGDEDGCRLHVDKQGYTVISVADPVDADGLPLINEDDSLLINPEIENDEPPYYLPSDAIRKNDRI